MLFNLISDLVGGIRITVLEEETAREVPAGDVPPPAPRLHPLTSVTPEL